MVPMQSVPVNTNVVSMNPVHCEVYWIQHYVIKFVRDLRQVGGFVCDLRQFSGFVQVLHFPPPVKLIATI